MRPGKIFLSLIIVILFLSNAAFASGISEAIPPQTNGRSVLLMDATSGRVLYEKNSSERLSPASLTKIMTALLVIENGELNKDVIISEYAASIPECTIYLEPKEILTRMELLYAVMLNSANDASTALAESISGDESVFVDLMNQRAGELGMEDTHFCNPHGLETDGHHTSAYDLAVLTREALSNQVFTDLVSTRQKLIPGAHEEDRVLSNINRLLYRYDGAIGVKTGYTQQAGNCVVGAARRGDMVLIAVSMNSTTVYDDLQQMLDYGFEHYHLVTLGKADEVSFDLEVENGESKTIQASPNQDLKVAAAEDEIPYLCYSVVPPTQVTAPVVKDDVLGVCRIFLNEEQVGSIDLLAGETVNIRSVNPFLASLGCLMTKWYFYVVGLLLTLILYKKKSRITWEECLKRILRLLLGKILTRQKIFR